MTNFGLPFCLVVLNYKKKLTGETLRLNSATYLRLKKLNFVLTDGMIIFTLQDSNG